MSQRKMTRGLWRTRLGFILAASGSAIGLGNIWKFPYITGQNGGGAFVLVYLVCVLLVGWPIMLAEFALGRRTRLNAVGAFRAIRPNSPWVIPGLMAAVACFLILSFYCVVGGWTLAFVVKSLTQAVAGFGSLEAASQYFGLFISHTAESLAYHALFLTLCVAIVIQGVQGGIEKACLVLMPAMVLLLLALMVHSLTLPAAMEGLTFYLYPDFSKITPAVVLIALGQAFFSLSLGMGIMITYGSYLSAGENLVGCTLSVVLFDTLIAILVGMVIFPAVYAMGFAPTEGPSLVFSVLPAVFSNLPYGEIVAVIFFVLLSIAAITSGISLLESVVAFFIDNLGWSRTSAALFVGGAVFVCGVPAGLSFGIMSKVQWMGMTFFEHIDNLASNFLLPLGGMLTAFFVGWIWGPKAAQREIEKNGSPFPMAGAWAFLLRYITPVLVLFVFLAHFI